MTIPGNGTVAAVVLAAGGGSRWSGPGHKLLADLDGRPLAAHAIAAAAAAGLDELVVVTGSVDISAIIPGGATVLHNGSWSEGQAGSIRLAVEHAKRAGHEAIVLGLADTPGIPAEAWRAVADAEGPLVVAVFDGLRRPPTKVGRRFWDELPVSGDSGARSLLAGRASHVVEVACSGDPADIDTVEDLRLWN